LVPKNPQIFISKTKSSKPSSNKDLRVETLKQRKIIFMTPEKKKRPPPNPKDPKSVIQNTKELLQ
jgi:hypothetical protein